MNGRDGWTSGVSAINRPLWAMLIAGALVFVGALVEMFVHRVRR